MGTSLLLANKLISSPTGAATFNEKCNLLVSDGISEYSFEVILENSTAFDVLKKKFDVEYTESEYGVFIIGIKTPYDWINQDSEHFWMWFINGELAEVSADYYYAQKGDNITFKYLSSEESMAYFE